MATQEQLKKANKKKLIQLRTKLNFYHKLDKKLNQIMNSELEIDDYSTEVYTKISSLEVELHNLKIEMDLSDIEWDKDETEK